MLTPMQVRAVRRAAKELKGRAVWGADNVVRVYLPSGARFAAWTEPEGDKLIEELSQRVLAQHGATREPCNAVIDLSRPCGSKRVRGFQPPWHTVFLYRCPDCGGVTTVRAGAFHGKTPVPGVGAILCPRLIYRPSDPGGRPSEVNVCGRVS